MRLTTLNLNQDCLDVLGTAKNKSRKARECILRYDEVCKQLEDMDDLYTKYLYAIRNLAAALAQDPNIEFLAEYLSETPVAVAKIWTAGYLPEAIVAAALRHVKP